MSNNNRPNLTIQPFLPGAPVSAGSLDAMRQMLIGGPSGTDAIQTPYPPPFVAKITGSSGANYSWTEQQQTGATTWIDLPGGRSGTTSVNPANEINASQSVATNTLVVMTAKVSAGVLRYWFQAPPNPAATFAVKVEQTGGSNGTDTTTASYTYTVRTLPWNGTSGGETLGTNVPVSRPRENGFVTVQAGSTGYGLAFYDGSTLRLWDAGEIYGTEECPEEE